MPERPVILFPTPERAGRSQKTPVFKNYRRPSFDRQYNRLQPTFQSLRTAFEQKSIIVQQSPVGINPDFALVFEIVGSVDNFYTAVNHCQGLEWLFDKDSSSIEPDDDFYEAENGGRSENTLDGKLYCVMSNQQAMEQLLSLWQRHINGEEAVFQRGFAGIRDVFTKIKAIRRWAAQDRISETHVVDYWREMLATDGDELVPFEIELFYRDDLQKRRIAVQTVTYEIQALGGRILQECTIGEISYHAILAELPRNTIEELINNFIGISLAHVDDIMFFRPTCQSVFVSQRAIYAPKDMMQHHHNRI